ncbi:FAD-dependent monooxygenase [Nitrococcus mobilis]|uniref:FAD-dependent monooxygenase n=1 Tax=Nitrococcus mobilis TaxID=35797 RepID=UPI0038CDACDE
MAIRADLVIGCDGRDSAVRAAAGLRVRDYGAPMDVLWFVCRARTAIRKTPSASSEQGR